MGWRMVDDGGDERGREARLEGGCSGRGGGGEIDGGRQ